MSALQPNTKTRKAIRARKVKQTLDAGITDVRCFCCGKPLDLYNRFAGNYATMKKLVKFKDGADRHDLNNIAWGCSNCPKTDHWQKIPKEELAVMKKKQQILHLLAIRPMSLRKLKKSTVPPSGTLGMFTRLSDMVMDGIVGRDKNGYFLKTQD